MAPHPPLSVAADNEQQNTSCSSSSASSSGGSSSSPPPAPAPPPAPLPLTSTAPSPPFDPLAPPSISAASLAIATAIPLPQQQLFQQYQHQLYQQQRLLSLHLSSASSPPGTGGGSLPLKSLSLPPPTALRSDPAPAPAPSAAGAASDRHSRDDCWSEGATVTLIQAWGYRYLDLNRGNLKQKHWKDVADSVNSRANGSKAPKTDIQCKNRLDTLKKKYKLEKSKIVTGGAPSKWTFFDRLDELIGPSKKPKKPTPVKLHSSPPPVPTLLTITGKRLVDEVEQKPLPQPLPPPPILNNASAPAANHFTPNHVGSAAEAASTSKGSHDTTDSCPNGGTADGKGLKRKRLHDNPMKLLARAIIKFGEVYERIETAKQQQMIELEKQRMKFTKDLELQRLQLFMQTQVELAKLKRNNKHCNTERYL